MSAVKTESNFAIGPVSVSVPQAMGPQPSVTQRVHYLDNLRAMAMLLGVFLHSALAYANPAQAFWLATDIKSSVAVDASIWFIHLFRMGLFFLLSGYFAKLVIERKGVKSFLWNRCVRIAGPFILFYPFLYGAMAIVFVFALVYLVEPQGIMGLVAKVVKDGTETRRPPPGTMHLWFLYYLMFFSAIGAALSNAKWLRLESVFRWRAMLVLCPLLLVPGAIGGGTPLAAPESFFPDWWPFAFYGLYFCAGWQLFGRESFLDACRPYGWFIALACSAMFVAYYLLMPELDLRILEANASASPITWIVVIEACLTAYLSALLTVGALLVGKYCLSNRSPILSFVADSSYWVYLLHLPIVLFLQTLLVPLAWPLWLKLGIVVMGTIIPSLATYVVFVRYTPIGWLLHGKRSFP